jgi:hypothetical protein
MPVLCLFQGFQKLLHAFGNDIITTGLQLGGAGFIAALLISLTCGNITASAVG